MEILFYVLKCYGQYVRTNTLGSGSIHLTKRLIDADRFSSKTAAKAFLQSVTVNSKNYMIDSAIKINALQIVSETMEIEDHSKAL